MNNTQQRFANRKYYNPITKTLEDSYPDNLTAYQHYHGHIPKSQFTPEQVRLIRAQYALGSCIAYLAQEYGVTPCTISNIVHLKTWKWVK